MIHWQSDLEALLVLVASNTIPVLVTRTLGKRFSAPIDAGLCVGDGRPLFGSHKTWRGLISGILAATVIGSAIGLSPLLAATAGALALAGDLLSSFVKRRLGRHSGAWNPGLDQLPEAVLPLLAMKAALALAWFDIALTAAIFSVMGALTSRFNDTLTGQQ